MAESTARVEKFEKAHASESLFYLWEVLEKPLAIRIALDFVDKLDREVVASFRSVTERGSEIGGILLGRIVPGAPPVVVIEDYERVACDYSRGPLYRLGAADKDRFDAVLRQRAGGSAQDLAVVGMFRSNTRKGLSLDPEDAAFFAERFHDPQQVALLVRPFATKPSVAAFFIRENGTVQTEASYLEFPFARAELAQQSLAMDCAPATAAPAPAPPAPKTPPRAQVVPIASRRETAAAVRQPAPEVLPPPAAAEPEPAAAEPQRPAEPEPAAVSAPPAVSPEPVDVPEAAAPIPPPPFLRQPESAPEAPFMSAGTPAPQRGQWIWIAGGSIAALLVVGLLFFYPGFLIRRGAPPAAAPATSNSLELRVERTAGQLLLTWNRETELIKTATKAVLSISDGQQRENVDLDLAQLRNGSVIYSPVTSDVNFRLDVTSSKPELSRSELVRVLGTRPSAMPPAGSEEARKNGKAAQPESAASAPESPAEEPAEAAAESAPAPPRKNLNTLSLAERLRPASPAELPEPPSFAGAVHTAPGLPMATAGVPAPPPVAAPAAPPSAAAPAAQEPMKVGGNVQEAKVIHRVDPVYPAIARQTRVRGVVEVQATIGKDGRVRQVRVLGGHPLLQQAAADAVRKWVYTPTLLNGSPVEVVTRVNVGFNFGN